MVGGIYIAQSGSLIAVIGLEPESKFIVELESGLDLEIMQSDIKYADF
jgi:hypothetical protein